MDYLSLLQVEELKKVGFSYPDYEHFLNYGMMFYYKDSEYFIGGRVNGHFSEEDILAAQNGVWLPDESQLIEWLDKVGFSVTITKGAEDMGYTVEAEDAITGTVFRSGGRGLLIFALSKTIKKICKSKEREYVPEPIERLPILWDE